MDDKKKIIFIIGMGRCGTSLMANCLIENGFHVGNTKNEDKDWQNPNGYFENDKFTEYHNKLLRQNGCKWNDIRKSKMDYTTQNINEYRNLLTKEFTNVSSILIKDPRLTFFTDFLKDVCSNDYEPYFLFCTRNKKECCDSLSKAQNMSHEDSEKLYNTTHEFCSDEFLKINHRDLIYSNTETVSHIAEFCDFEIKRDVSDIVDLELYRNRKDEEL